MGALIGYDFLRVDDYATLNSGCRSCIVDQYPPPLALKCLVRNCHEDAAALARAVVAAPEWQYE